MSFTADHLQPHPEGGRFKEVHRSPHAVTSPEGKQKSALTHIYFELKKGEVSRFHRVRQEEVWNLYQGRLRLWILNPENSGLTSIELSAEADCFCTVIPAGHWQAAEPLEERALAGCSVAPGFDFEDFELITPDHPLSGMLQKHHLGHLI